MAATKDEGGILATAMTQFIRKSYRSQEQSRVGSVVARNTRHSCYRGTSPYSPEKTKTSTLEVRHIASCAPRHRHTAYCQLKTFPLKSRLFTDASLGSVYAATWTLHSRPSPAAKAYPNPISARPLPHCRGHGFALSMVCLFALRGGATRSPPPLSKAANPVQIHERHAAKVGC